MKYLPFFSLFILSILACNQEPQPPPPPPEPPLFQLMEPAHTGITFTQTITEEHRYNFSIDPNIFNGGGVAVLDVNNDGLQDLFFTSRLQTCRLYLNKGGFRFEDISETAGVSKDIGIKTGVSVVDINADGWQDVYVCRTFLTPIPERRNLLFVNNRNNTFSEKAADYGLDDISPTQHAHFFDYDLDGDLDCYLLNHPVDYKQINNIDFLPSENRPLASMRPPLDEMESDKLLRNDNGRFVNVGKQAGIYNRAWGLSLMSGDFNADGWPDIYVANDFIMPDFLYINQGDGTFREEGAAHFQHITNHAMGIEWADLTNDGLPELLALDMLGENWERRRKQLTTMQLERYKKLLAQGYGDQQMRNTLQLNNGNGHFSEVGCLAGVFATEWSWAPLAADFDNDGWKDVFITNGVRRDLNDIDFFVFTADSINRTGGIGQDRFKNFEDFSKLMPSEKISNRMFKNPGHLPFKEVTAAWGFSQPTFSNGAAYADLDNDGDLDLVVHNVDDPPFVYQNKSTEISGNNWLQIKLKGTPQNPTGTGAKITAYQQGELIAFQEMTPVRGFYSSVEPVFQIGLGNQQQLDALEIEWPGGLYQRMENVAANQRLVLEIAPTNEVKQPRKAMPAAYFEKIPSPRFRHVENEFEDFDRERLLPRRYSRQGPALAVGDANGDGLDDFFIGGAAGQAGQLFFQNKNGGFENPGQSDLAAAQGSEDTGALFFDADSDGAHDLLVVAGGNEFPMGDARYDARLYRNDGKGGFSPDAHFPKINVSGKAIAAHDFDGDGDMDLFIGGRLVPGRFPETPPSFVLENDNGRFSDATERVFPAFQKIGMVTALHFANVQGDAQKELIVAGDWMPISIYEIKNGRLAEAPISRSVAAISGWWHCLESADLDGDGDLDLLAGNTGLNTRFQSTLHLYAADFDSNGSMDPILFVEENGRTVPVPMRDDLVKQLPYLKKKFVRNTAYSKASIQDLFSENELGKSQHLRAETLASCWFENRDGAFIRHPFPDRAQIAPVHGLRVLDANKDGHLDILLAGNDAGYDVQTGPLDTSSGCLLLGNGSGTFTAVPPHHSGFWAVLEARGLFPLKLAGADAFLVPNNDNDVLIFRTK